MEKKIGNTAVWAIQGGRGSFHHIAAQHFGMPKEECLRPCTDFYSVARISAEDIEAQGVMAIENSVAGSILRNYALLHTFPLQISAEVYLQIGQNLLVNPGSTLETVQEVHSHPMALAQCGQFLRKQTHMRLVETEDTAMSAEALAAKPTKTKAAIASRLAAKLFGLEVLAANIEDHHENYTRFLLLQKKHKPEPARKASLAMVLPHQQGALLRILEAAAKAGLNLTKIQSLPLVGSPWHYRFYIDVEHAQALEAEQLQHLFQPITEELQVLGIYAPGEITFES